MGFPTIYYCVILPTPLVVVLQILDLIRLSLTTALAFLGVRCPMLELPALPPPPQSSLLDRPDDDAAGGPAEAFAYDRLYPLSDLPGSSSPPPPSPSPSSIKRRLPVVRLAALRRSSGAACDAPASCPICLCGLEARHQVRLLDNCRHVFHKGCIDRWVDQGQSTCPLCRSRLLRARSRARETRRRDVDDVVTPSSSGSGNGSSWLADSLSSLFRGAAAAADDSPPYSVAPSLLIQHHSQ